MQIYAILQGLASDEEVIVLELYQRLEGIQARLDELEQEQIEIIYELDLLPYKETEDSQIMDELLQRDEVSDREALIATREYTIAIYKRPA